MNEKCKYCKYLNKCSDRAEYNSFYCLVNRRFPKIVEKSYDELLEENKYLKNKINKTINKLSFIDKAIENNSLSTMLCIAKINSALEILKDGDK